MHFLIDADLPRSVSDTLRHYGHQATDVRDIGLRSAKDPQIAHYAQTQQLCILTGDYDFSDIRNYPPHQYHGIVVLSIPRNANAAYINQLLDNFIKQSDLLAELAGKLAIVEPGHVRLRE
jgi:predicted nuclease of predicted toxin-antitoxin system